MDLCAMRKQIQQMDIDTLLGQLLCYSVTPKWSEEEFAQIVRRTKPGGLFLTVPMGSLSGGIPKSPMRIWRFR